MKICVFGASSRELAQGYYDAAYELGAQLARRGHELVFGGGTSGLMGAAARGVVSEGGRLTGVAPRFFDEPGILFEGCTDFVFTETMSERKKAMEDMSDAFVTLPGGIGTFEEFFEALTLKQLGRHAKAMAVRAVEERFFPEDGHALYAVFTDAAALLDYVESYEAEPEDVWKEKILGKYNAEK